MPCAGDAWIAVRKLLYGFGVLVAIVVLSVVAYFVRLPSSPFGLWLTATTCRQDDQIPVDERAPIEAAALAFVRALVATDPAAHSQMTSEAQRVVTRDALLALARDNLEPGGPLEQLHVAETFLVQVAGTSSTAPVICGKPGRAEDRVSVTAAPIPKQAYVFLKAQSRYNGWIFVLLLKPEDGWRVARLQFNIETIMGTSAQDYREAAHSEQNLGHPFNAAMLYLVAKQLAYRGPHVQLGIQSEIERELAAVELPDLLRGQPPFTWHLQEQTFRVLQVGPFGIRGKNYLSITHEILAWTQDAEADRRNRALIREFSRAVPEYSSAFAGLRVVAQEKGGKRSYSTYDPPVDPEQ
jgi:hypothetical protein